METLRCTYCDNKEKFDIVTKQYGVCGKDGILLHKVIDIETDYYCSVCGKDAIFAEEKEHACT